MKFFKLFEPLEIGNVTISNRIVMPALNLNMANDGYITQQLIDFYVERAKGGAGMLIVGGCYVDLYGKGVPMMISIDNDEFLPSLTSLTKAVHEARDDVKICAQMYHGGAYTMPLVIGKTPIAPSAVYSKFSKSTPREMTLEDIKTEQQAFADASVRAKKAGFDAVEVCANAGYLMTQFISPKTNKRTDNYGGDLEDRLRFPLETLELMRSKLDNIPLGYRISGDDFVPGSNTYKEKAVIAERLSEYLDYFNVTGGWHETKTPQTTMDVPEGCYSYLAENIKNHVSIPVFASNRINTPELAEQILMARKADAVCMGRTLIADPYLPVKAKKGEIRDIMNCIGCNQGCFDAIFSMQSVTCLRNARAGKEAKTELKPLEIKKNVMIIGSGPAGLEAARVAAMRGHEVHLYEKADKIGGLLNIIWIPPGRNEFKRMIENYTYWIQKYNIHIHLQQEITTDKVKEINPDVVFVATGSIPNKPPITGIDRDNVFWANSVFTGDAPIGKNNVIIGGGSTGIELAIYIAKYGSMDVNSVNFLTQYKALEPEVALKMMQEGRNKVTILEQLPKLGSALGKTTKWVLLDKCDYLGVKKLTSVKVTEIGENYVSYTDATDTEQQINDVDYVYHATGVKSNDSLFKELKSTKIPVEKLGDAKKPQTVMEAISRGYNLGNRI
ncbi:MAG: FAD-dependent oxidoreductase [Candidatus Lokiarchaeota archaeon]|nr:FAD-dependent oxidoreductase [Candidatus Lokiarchaeota archaeon]